MKKEQGKERKRTLMKKQRGQNRSELRKGVFALDNGGFSFTF